MTPSKDFSELIERLRRACVPVGLDLFAPLSVGLYNRRVDPAYALPEAERTKTLAVAVGNTAALWPPFVEALRADPRLLAAAHPVERFVTAALERAVGELGVAAELRWAHELQPGRLFSAQQLCVAAGLAHLAPCQLCIHPTHGPWIAVRAAVVFEGFEGPAEVPPADPVCQRCEDRPCLPMLEFALAATKAQAGVAPAEVRPAWRRWVAMRDACPVGRASRYSEAQVRYHYTKDRDELEAAVGQQRDVR